MRYAMKKFMKYHKMTNNFYSYIINRIENVFIIDIAHWNIIVLLYH